jgi:hypothetical protein
LFGLLLGAAGGAAWALWNANESGAQLQAKARRTIDDLLGRGGAAPAPIVSVREPSRPLPEALSDAPPSEVRAIESALGEQQGEAEA